MNSPIIQNTLWKMRVLIDPEIDFNLDICSGWWAWVDIISNWYDEWAPQNFSKKYSIHVITIKPQIKSTTVFSGALTQIKFGNA